MMEDDNEIMEDIMLSDDDDDVRDLAVGDAKIVMAATHTSVCVSSKHRHQDDDDDHDGETPTAMTAAATKDVAKATRRSLLSRLFTRTKGAADDKRNQRTNIVPTNGMAESDDYSTTSPSSSEEFSDESFTSTGDEDDGNVNHDGGNPNNTNKTRDHADHSKMSILAQTFSSFSKKASTTATTTASSNNQTHHNSTVMDSFDPCQTPNNMEDMSIMILEKDMRIMELEKKLVLQHNHNHDPNNQESKQDDSVLNGLDSLVNEIHHIVHETTQEFHLDDDDESFAKNDLKFYKSDDSDDDSDDNDKDQSKTHGDDTQKHTTATQQQHMMESLQRKNQKLISKCHKLADLVRAEHERAELFKCLFLHQSKNHLAFHDGARNHHGQLGTFKHRGGVGMTTNEGTAGNNKKTKTTDMHHPSKHDECKHEDSSYDDDSDDAEIGNEAEDDNDGDSTASAEVSQALLLELAMARKEVTKCRQEKGSGGVVVGGVKMWSGLRCLGGK